MKLRLEAGKGGDGSRSYARFAREPLAGPDGGDGGKGGDVILAASPALDDLSRYANRDSLAAEPGKPGLPGKKYGKDGADLVVELPPGTIIRDADAGTEIARLMNGGESVVLFKGGQGGKGNVKYATATIRTPNHAEPGRPGESREVEILFRQPAPIAIMESTASAGDDYYFRLYAGLSGNRPKEYFFYTRKPRIFFLEKDYRKYSIAFLPYVFDDLPGGAPKFPNIEHVYFVEFLVFALAGIEKARREFVLGKWLSVLAGVPHRSLKSVLIVLGGNGESEAQDAIDRLAAMCDNHAALSGVEVRFASIPQGDGPEAFSEVREMVAEMGADSSSGA